MTEIERKALALVNEVQNGRGHTGSPWNSPAILNEALYRAIEQHEAFRQEVSDAIEALKNDVGAGWDHSRVAYACNRFIIAKPDPLIGVVNELGLGSSKTAAEELRAALAKHGLKLERIEHE